MPSRIRIGTAGWSYKDWEGIFYPPGMRMRKQHPLELVARCFDVVEINTSFYGHIKPELAKLWARKVAAVNPDFIFTAKLHRSFTHSPIAVMEPTSAATIRPSDEDERLARQGLDALASIGKFGALLIQFPVSFKNTSLNREYLESLLRQFIEYPRVVEVRHSSWDNPETLAYFTRKNVAFCNIDQPLIGRSLEATEYVTSPVGYVRLHGRNYDMWFEAERGEDRYNYLYNETELVGMEREDRTHRRESRSHLRDRQQSFSGQSRSQCPPAQIHAQRPARASARAAVRALSGTEEHRRSYPGRRRAGVAVVAVVLRFPIAGPRQKM